MLATLTDQSSVEGRLAAVDDDGVQLDDRRLAWTEIARGRMQVDFSAPELATDAPDGDR